MKKQLAHLVFIPFPGVGHIASAIEFAKLLINSDERLSVSVFAIKLPSDDTTTHDDNNKNNTVSSLLTNSSEQRMQVIYLPQYSSSNDSDSTTSPMLTLIENQKPLVKQAVSDLTHSDSAPPLAAFVVDMFCTAMIDVAREFHVPALVYFTSGVAFLGLMLHLHTLLEQDNLDTAQLEGSDTELTIPSFANPVPAKVLPGVAIRKEWNSFFTSYAKGLKRADGIIVNSFEELESHAVHSFSEDGVLPIYPVGPILKLNHLDSKSKTTDESHESENEIIKWLDDQPPSSVVFLCFGSMGALGEDQVKEIARALEATGARFLWSLRKPSPPNKRSIMARPSDYAPSELAAVLPEGFLDRTAEIGRVIGWAPQVKVLAHQATGGFVSHCGWNSTLESIYFGVPIATWPLYAEQQINAFELVCELKMAVEIALDYKTEPNVGSNYLLSAERIERGIRNVLEQESEIRKKVKEMSEKSKKTLMEGGSSNSYLRRLIDFMLNQV